MTHWQNAAFVVRARVERSIAQLNRGETEEMLSRYVDNVSVRVPIYRPGDPLGAPDFVGKDAFREFLLRYLAAHQSYTVRDVFTEANGMMISLECLKGDRMTVKVELNAEGLGERVTIFVT